MNEIEVNLESKKKIITTFENGKEIQIVFSVKNKTEDIRFRQELDGASKANN